MKAFALSACLISLHLDALLCGEDYFPHACLDEIVAISMVSLILMRLSLSIFTMGCRKLCCYLLSELVNPFASGCVWEGMSCTVYLIYPRLC